MASSTELLQQWVENPKPTLELQRQAERAFARIRTDVPPELLARVFDRLLWGAAHVVYRNVHRLPDEAWTELLKALARSRGVEARLLVAAERRGQGRGEVAQFVALLASASNVQACTSKVVASQLSKSRAVTACARVVLEDGYPDFQVALAGVVAALAVFGDPKQRKALYALRPPDEAVGWLRLSAAKMPRAAAARMLEHLEGREDDGTFPSPPFALYRPLVTDELPEKVQAPANPPAHAPAALAAIYAEPENDEPRSIYADALLELGHPLGELIQLQLARAKGKKGTLARERLLMDEHRTKLWPDHPCGIGGTYLTLEDLDRGFPMRFSTSNDPNAKVRKQLSKALGWATIRDFTGWYEKVPLGTMLPAQMPSLRRLAWIGAGVFNTIRDRDWPVEELLVVGDAPIGKVTGFPRLKKFTLVTEASVEGALKRLGPSGLPARLERLELSLDEPDANALRTYPSPEEVLDGLRRTAATELVVDGSFMPTQTARRVGSGFALEIAVEEYMVDRVLAALAALDPKSVQQLTLELKTNGSFTKKARSVAEAASRKVLARFKGSKLISVPRAVAG